MYKHILVPVVLDEDSNVQASYAVARALADAGAKLTVMHVMETIQGFVAINIPPEALAKAERSARNALDQSAKALPGAETVLTRGHPGTVIINYASENDVDCIVIASHKPGIEDFFLGSTAARVVRHATCSVHVIR